jgi:hypothetical protein
VKSRNIFPSSEGGKGLISIENGTKVVQTLLAVTKKEKLKLPFHTSAMVLMCFLISLYCKPHATTKNDSAYQNVWNCSDRSGDKNTF